MPLNIAKYPSRCFLLAAVLVFSWLSWSPLPQWLDGAELTLSATHLGVAHPPGQPFYSLLMHIINYLPFSTPPLRLCFLLSFIYLTALILLFKAANKSPFAAPGVVWFAALALFAAGQAQVGRQELYAVNFLFFTWSYLVSQRLHSPTLQAKELYTLCFLSGLAFCNHTLLALASSGLLLGWGVWHVHKQRPRLQVWYCSITALLLGLLPYLYLPLRALKEPAINYGDASNWSNFLWIVSGELYSAYSQHGAGVTRWLLNGRDVIALYGRFLSPLVLLVAVIGWVKLLKSGWRKQATAILLILSSVAAVLPNGHFNMGNPDLWGYLLPGFCLFVLLGLTALDEKVVALWRRGKTSRIFLMVLTTALIIFLLLNTWDETRDYRQPETDRFVFAISRSLPPHSEVVTTSYVTFAQLRYFQAVEHYRRDLRLQYRGDPHNFPMQESDLLRWSAQAPLYYELSLQQQGGGYALRDSVSLLQRFMPAGWFYKLEPEAVAINGLSTQFHRQKYFWDAFLPLAPSVIPLELRRRALLAHSLNTLYFDAVGFDEGISWEKQFHDLELQDGVLIQKAPVLHIGF